MKLLMHLAAAVCRFCSRHEQFASEALQVDSVCDLLLAAILLGLDPSAIRFQSDLRIAAAALLGSINDWEGKLPQLANLLVSSTPTPAACLRALRQLPADPLDHPRGWQLLQFSGCILLTKAIPGKGMGLARSDVCPDLQAVLDSQPWFKDPKTLVINATPSLALKKSANRATGYTITDVEILLKICNLLLWPYALAAWSPGGGGDQETTIASRPKPLDAHFLGKWKLFLSGIYRNIKTLQPEDQAVKSYANRLEIVYEDMIIPVRLGPLSPVK